jgi:integrase
VATTRPFGETGDAWEVRVYVGQDRRGRPRQISRIYRGPKRGLNRFAAELEKQFDDVGVDGATATVAQLLDRWLLQHPEWAPYTRRDYRYRVAAIKDDRIASVRLARLGVKSVEDWIARMRSTGVGEGAIRSRVTALRAAITDAQRWDWVARNVAGLARLEGPRKEEREPMPPELVLAILAAGAEQGLRQRLALRLAAISGAREAELAAIRWDDRKGQQLRIDSQIQTVDGIRVDRLTKSASSERIVTLDPDTLVQWDTLKADLVAPGPYVFARDGVLEPPCARTLYEWFRKAIATIDDTSHWRFHDLRHWSATTALSRGHDLRTIAARLGNSPEVILRTYAHLLRPSEESLAASLADVLVEPDEPEHRGSRHAKAPIAKPQYREA